MLKHESLRSLHVCLGRVQDAVLNAEETLYFNMRATDPEAANVHRLSTFNCQWTAVGDLNDLFNVDNF